MNVLVTGASGFIGSWVVEALGASAPQASVIGLGRREISGTPSRPANYEYIRGDLLDRPGLRRLLPRHVDVVMHLAGDPRARLPVSEWGAQTAANVMGTSAAAEYAVEAGARLFVLASSVYVYSGVDAPPYREDRLELPAENLGAGKLAAEALLRARALAGDFRAVGLRVFTVYGPGSRPEQFIADAVRKLRSDEPVARFGPPDVTRDLVFVADVAAAFVATLRLPEMPEPYLAINVGTGVETSVREVVQILARLVGVDKPVEFSTDQRAWRVGAVRQAADVSRARRVLGWEAGVPLEAGLRRTVDSLLAPHVCS